jgi:hypothetical protein
MDLVPEVLLDDRVVLARVFRALVHGLADIDAVVQDAIEVTLVDRLALLVEGTFFRQHRDQLFWRCTAREAGEDRPD